MISYQSKYGPEEGSTSPAHNHLLARSILTVIMNRVKFNLKYASKNAELGRNTDFRSFVNILSEQILPQFIE